MDIRLRTLVDEPAGTYFLVTDNSNTTEGITESKVRVFFLNEERGPVNTGVYFKRGAITAFQNIFGKRMRKKEKLGNFGIYQVITALQASDVVVINLRSFNEQDKIGVNGISPNTSTPENKLAEYSKIFNQNGFWTVKGKNIKDILTNEHYLNFGNVGKNNLSFFVVKSKTADTLTSQSKLSLANTTLDIEDYPALVSNEIILEDTFVDVYVFNNTFDPATVSTNKFYGQYFNEAGLVKTEDLQNLSNITEAGFVRKITGSLIPNLKNESNEVISIDSLVNSYYSETGLVCYINDNMLEDETIGGLPVLNTTMEGYYDTDGTVNAVGYMLSYRAQNVTPFVVNIDAVKSEMIKDLSNEFLVKTTGDIFPKDTNNQPIKKQVYSVFENNIRPGAKILFKDPLTNKLNTSEVVSVEIVNENLPNTDGNQPRLGKSVITVGEITDTTVEFSFTQIKATLPGNGTQYADQYIVSRRTVDTGSASDNTFMPLTTLPLINSGTGVLTYKDVNLTKGKKYAYLITAKGSNVVDSYSVPMEVLVDGTNGASKNNTDIVPNELPDKPISNAKWKKLLLTLSDEVTDVEYNRILDIRDYNNAMILPSNLSAYIPRQEQFLNGSAAKQKEILDMMLEPGIVKGLKNMSGLKWFVDSFKSFVEPNFKYQYYSLIEILDKSNKFARAFVNDPFYEDLDNSVNPLLKDNPGSPLNIEDYLEQGGNPTYSTVFLTKPSSTFDYACYSFGSEVDTNGNEYPITAQVSNLFYAKKFSWDIVANTTGILNLNGIPFNPDAPERKAIEKFKSNPIIKDSKGFKIYGNKTCQKNPTGLAQIHNSELLAFIKDSLYQMSQDETFKKTTAQEFLATEVEYQSFMDSLALAGAVAANPIVICSLVNNPEDVQKAKMKVITVKYTQIDGNDKVVFDLNLN